MWHDFLSSWMIEKEKLWSFLRNSLARIEVSIKKFSPQEWINCYISIIEN